MIVVKEFCYPLLNKRKVVLDPYASPIFLATFKNGMFLLRMASARKRPVPYHRAAPSPSLSWSSYEDSRSSLGSWSSCSSYLSSHSGRSRSPRSSPRRSRRSRSTSLSSSSSSLSLSSSSSSSIATLSEHFTFRSASRSPSVHSCYSVYSTSSGNSSIQH